MRSYHSSACRLAGICPAVTCDLSRPADSSGRGQRQHGSSLSLAWGAQSGAWYHDVHRTTHCYVPVRLTPTKKIKVKDELMFPSDRPLQYASVALITTWFIMARWQLWRGLPVIMFFFSLKLISYWIRLSWHKLGSNGSISSTQWWSQGEQRSTKFLQHLEGDWKGSCVGYTGWFTMKAQYYERWQYRSLWRGNVNMNICLIFELLPR